MPTLMPIFMLDCPHCLCTLRTVQWSSIPECHVRTQYTCTLHQLWLSDQLTKAVHFFCNHRTQNTDHHWHTPVHVEQASPVKNFLWQKQISFYKKKFSVTGRKTPSEEEVSCHRKIFPLTGQNFLLQEDKYWGGQLHFIRKKSQFFKCNELDRMKK